MGTKELAEQYVGLKRRKDQLEDELDQVKAELDTVGKDLLLLMQADDISKFSTTEGTFYTNTIVRASISDQEKAFTFLRNNNLGGIIKETVHSQTLTATFKELCEQGLIDPATSEQVGIKVYTEETIRLRKA